MDRNAEENERLTAALREIEANVKQYKRQRFIVMMIVQFLTGAILVLPPDNKFTNASYLLDQLGQTHRAYGLFYIVGGVALYIARHRPRSLRVVHALLAGAFGLIAIIDVFAIAAGFFSSAVYAGLFIFVSWEHMRAGMSSEPLFRKRGSK